MEKIFAHFPYCIIVSLALQKEGDDFSLCAIGLTQEQILPGAAGAKVAFKRGKRPRALEVALGTELWHFSADIYSQPLRKIKPLGQAGIFLFLAKHKYSNRFRIYLNQ